MTLTLTLDPDPDPNPSPNPNPCPYPDQGGRGAEAASSLPGQGHSLLPFAPAMLERKLEKVDRESARREIDNSLDGLRAYLEPYP